MLLSRDDLVSALFCETDRAQRLRMPLALIHIGFLDWANRRAPLEHARDDEVVCMIVERFTRILRCYDSVGQVTEGEFVLILPGCSLFDAKTLTERIRDGLFGSPFEVGGEEMRLNACFGIASSGGRSPFVVLREAKKALQRAQAKGPGSIHRLGAAEELARTSSLSLFHRTNRCDGNRR
jgi:diguanylate cyclase (GGDEF)-like protein